MVEEYRVIKEFENYAISNTGKVKRIKRGQHTNIDKELYQSTNNSGYKTVILYKEKKSYCKTVHKLVAEAFLEKPKDSDLIKYDIDHIDNDKSNNNLENLHYITHKENIQKYTSTLKNHKRPDWHIQKMKEGWKKRKETIKKKPKIILKKYYEVNYNGIIYEFNTQKEINEKLNSNISVRYIMSGKCKNTNITITKKYREIKQ